MTLIALEVETGGANCKLDLDVDCGDVVYSSESGSAPMMSDN